MRDLHLRIDAKHVYNKHPRRYLPINLVDTIIALPNLDIPELCRSGVWHCIRFGRVEASYVLFPRIVLT